eukprot:g8930.t1
MPFITGVLKQRYADFQVYEINRDNQKAVIDSLLKRSLKKKRGSESNETDTGKSSNKRPRNIDKLLRRAKRRKVKASLMWQNRNDFWRRYLCGSTGHSGESLMSSDSDELIKKIADRQSSSLSRWQSYLVYGGKEQEPVILTEPQKVALQQLESILGQEPASNFKLLLQDRSRIVKFPSSDDKNLRRRVHMAIKEFRSFSILADTIVDERTKEKIVRVRSSAKGGNGARSSERRNEIHKFDQRGFKEKWQESLGGEYLQFVLYKENVETNKALASIAALLRIKAKNRLFINGTKDKRAATAQFVTAYRVKPDELALINQRRGGPCGNLWIGSKTKYVKSKAYLGNLYGNEFHIVLRDVGFTDAFSAKNSDAESKVKQVDESVRNAIEVINTVGFINYFGLQRFGTGDIPTHLVGKALLRKNWKEAVDLIMTGKDGERQDVAEARNAYRSGNISLCMKLMPRYMNTEWTILKSLSKQRKRLEGNDSKLILDYSAAFHALPRHLRQLYTHAYQSYVWNRLVSSRFQSSNDSTNAIVGDLVVADDSSGNPMGDGSSSNNTPTSTATNYKHLTEADVNSGKYSIQDVVFPLIGIDTKYPRNRYGEVILQILKADGISTQDLEAAANVDTSFRGSYRKIIQKARNASYEIKVYKGKNNDTLCPTGLGSLITGESGYKRREQEQIDDADRIAVILHFQLPKSTYATMCLRQIALTST